MGYRSDVAYVIKFENFEKRDAFVSLMLAKNDAHITQAIGETSHEQDTDPIITFRCDDTKWYETYPDVKAHHTLMDLADDLYKAQYRFIAIGEDGAEDLRENEHTGELYDYVSTVHQLHTSF
jgi:hypothetical protein